MHRALVLLRHAQSEWNALRLWQGQADPPLSAEGRRQATQAAMRLAETPGYRPFDLVVTSDLTRARDTAGILATELGLTGRPIPEPGLREFDAGYWSGHTLAEIEEKWPGDVERFTHGRLDSPPGGESRVAFDARVSQALARLGSLAERYGARSVLVVAHGGVIGSMARSAGLERRHTGHLAGYVGELSRRGMRPVAPIDLLEARELAADTA
jgi:probable phosphoglycerate mutase